ncbi:MAG: alpha/beta hydrolase-fold protein [Kofleriaceae bacterium]
MRKDPSAARGHVHTLEIDSQALRANLLGDPHVREVGVYVPPGSDGAGLPLLVDLVGFTGSGFSHLAWRNFGENVPERLDRLIAAGMPPVVVAFPDCFTRLGGNQYLNSAAMGRWEDFLLEEMLPAVERRFGCGGAGRRGVFGKSSGGYGALVHAMLHADVWSAAACHSGDMGFELVYARDFPVVLRALARHGSIEAAIRHVEQTEKPSDADVHVLMTLAMAATYDPDPSAFLGVRLPVDLHTCERLEERWARWLAWDPLTLVERAAPALRTLRALYVDCGDLDQYNLVYGARVLHRRLEELGVPHHYEEFPDDHTKVDYRMDVSLPLLARALSEKVVG